ncbi:MAG: hydroxymethylpyrimidine/phosphomethylpyrimidine kinase [Herminiimonas sp.]|nr:hydroxymethylpyrimidine/phosphomethylpyrimidine kinase [Herminiimonas sp.]
MLVFAGADPSGGAGVTADVQAIAAVGAHALPVITVLTVQDNNRVHAIHPVPAEQVRAQARALMVAMSIDAVKIGIVGSRANAACIAELLIELKTRHPDLPIVLDPVLASGHGDALTREDALEVVAPLLAHATLVTPNLPEAAALCAGVTDVAGQAASLIARGARHVLIKGGHGEQNAVVNRWFDADGATRDWQWPRLSGSFHGSGCTLASAIAGLLAQGHGVIDAIDGGQRFTQQALEQSFSIGPGQRIPERAVCLIPESRLSSKELS